jgi:hypothetical protein
MPLPNNDFDPTEAGVPWRVLRDRGHRIVFATPDGTPGETDPRIEDEVRAALAQREDFLTGPVAPTRDSPGNPQAGFTVRDDNYLSASWPGDAHRFADEFASMVERPNA